MRRLLVALAAVLVLVAGTRPQDRRHVILVTLDGARIEEMFAGLDLAVLTSTLRKKETAEAHPLYLRYWAPTPEARREKLMPFFWGTLMRQHGSIAGNRALGSEVRLTNRHWFSYPGYAEMLVGIAHDDVINSNDPVQNPYPTVLEFLQTKLNATREEVAVFASWSIVNALAESKAGALTINAGFEAFSHPDPVIQRMSAQQFETPTPWDTVRHDVYTFRFAMAHLAAYKPRVLYLSLGETDDWAHDGRYDRVLDAFRRSDDYLRELWDWLQSQPDYRGRTSLLLTTDHGRGRTPLDWRDHGEKHQGAGDTWMAFVTPAMTSRGEWQSHPPLTASQVASTLLSWMGLDWREFNPNAAPPVDRRQRP